MIHCATKKSSPSCQTLTAAGMRGRILQNLVRFRVPAHRRSPGVGGRLNRAYFENNRLKWILVIHFGFLLTLEGTRRKEVDEWVEVEVAVGRGLVRSPQKFTCIDPDGIQVRVRIKYSGRFGDTQQMAKELPRHQLVCTIYWLMPSEFVLVQILVENDQCTVVGWMSWLYSRFDRLQYPTSQVVSLSRSWHVVLIRHLLSNLLPICCPS